MHETALMLTDTLRCRRQLRVALRHLPQGYPPSFQITTMTVISASLFQMVTYSVMDLELLDLQGLNSKGLVADRIEFYNRCRKHQTLDQALKRTIFLPLRQASV